MKSNTEKPGSEVMNGIDHRITKQQSRFRWLRLGLLNVVFLIAPFGAWYFMHVQDRLETNSIRSFRSLNEIDTVLADNVGNLRKIWLFSDAVTDIKYLQSLPKMIEETDKAVQLKEQELQELELADNHPTQGLDERGPGGIGSAANVQELFKALQEQKEELDGLQSELGLSIDTFERSVRLAEELSSSVRYLQELLSEKPFGPVSNECQALISETHSWASENKIPSLNDVIAGSANQLALIRQKGFHDQAYWDKNKKFRQVVENVLSFYFTAPSSGACSGNAVSRVGSKSSAQLRRFGTAETRPPSRGAREFELVLTRVNYFLDALLSTYDHLENIVQMEQRVQQAESTYASQKQKFDEAQMVAQTEVQEDWQRTQARTDRLNRDMDKLKQTLDDFQKDLKKLEARYEKSTKPSSDYVNAIRRNPALRNFKISAVETNQVQTCKQASDKIILTNIRQSNNRFIIEAVCNPEATGEHGSSDRQSVDSVDPARSQSPPNAESIPLVEVPIDDLLKSVTAGVAIRFDHIILADSEGHVISQVRTRISEDSKLVGAIATDPFRYDFFHYSNLNPVLSKSNGCDSEGGVLDTGQQNGAPVARSHAFTCRLFVGKTAFDLFVQPSVLRGVSLDGKDSQWFVIGVSKTTELTAAAYVAPLSVSGPMLVLIIIALAALPLLWLATKSQSSLLTTTHCVAALSGGISILSLTTILAMHFLFARDYGLQQDVSLQQLNNRISTDFNIELDERITGLESQWVSSSNCVIDDAWIQRGYPPYEVKFVLGRRLSSPDAAPEKGVSLVAPQHMLFYTPKQVKVDSREYYRKPASGDAWQKFIRSESGAWILDGSKGDFHPFFVERIRSFVDGVKESVVAIPLEPTNRCGENSITEVLVEILPFHSLTNVAMPPQHGFAIVERGSGKVLYHSSDHRSLEENFIDETDGNQQLISMLQSRSEDFVNLDYQGKSVRAYVTPMTDLPWSLVTFIDDEMIDTVLLESLITATGLAISFVVLLLITFWLYARLFDGRSAHRSIDWLWPNCERSRAYPAIFSGAVLMSLIFVVAAVSGKINDTAIHQLYFIAPFVVLMILRLRRSFKPAGKSNELPKTVWLRNRPRVLFLILLLEIFLVINWGAWSIYTLALMAIALPLGLTYWIYEQTPDQTISPKNSQESKQMNHLRLLLPLATILMIMGPVSGVILYLASVEVYSDSYAHYADDQILRALELREINSRRHFRRYNNDGEAPLLPEPFTINGTGKTATCPGTYLGNGPFLIRPGKDDKVKDFCQQQFIKSVPFDETDCKVSGQPRLLDNWVFWFVSRVPAFSFESGAIQQSSARERGSDRLRWCNTGPDGVTFVGTPEIATDTILQMPASVLEYQYLSTREVEKEVGIVSDDSIRLSVMASVLTFALLIAVIGYAIARTISNHMFGTNIPPVMLDTVGIDSLKTWETRQKVLISPLPLLAILRAEYPGTKYPKVLWFGPASWGRFKNHIIAEDEILIVEETESQLRELKRRSLLEKVLQVAVDQNARVILIMRTDPAVLLNAADNRSLTEPALLDMKQAEVDSWRSLLNHFKVQLIKECSTEGKAVMEGCDWENLHFQNWTESTLEERNTLANLALSDLFNPRNTGVIRHLVRRGLVTEDPPYRLLSSDFKSYILANTDLESLAVWRKQGNDSLWSALWPTLLVIIGLLMFFVISAGQSTVKTAMALLASVIASMPVLLSVFAAVRSNSSSGGGS